LAYTINKTDGSIFATVSDGTINSDSSITIIGKNYAGYGAFLGENFIRLLESGANATIPISPLSGQLWFDKTSGILKFYNGTIFKSFGVITTDNVEPTNVLQGDQWFDSANKQLKIYDGADFILVGPAFTGNEGTSGAIVETITDNNSVDHVVVKEYVEGAVVAVISKDPTFIVDVPFDGFTSTINPGIQLSSNVVGGVPQFHGQAIDSVLFNGKNTGQFLASDANDTTSGSLGILNDNGISIGVDNDLQIYVLTDHNYIENKNDDGHIYIRVKGNGASPDDVLFVNGLTSRCEVALPIGDNDVTNKIYVTTAITAAETTLNIAIAANASNIVLNDNDITTINNNIVTINSNITNNDNDITTINNSMLKKDGSNTITGSILPSTTNSKNFGSSSKKFATIYATTFNGTATTAQYADLAERFESDTEIAPGTVVQLGGAKEITKAIDALTEDVFGVISTEPGFIMNEAAGDEKTHPRVAMTGRVPVNVVGPVKKGARLVHAGNGVARAAKASEANSFNVIGRALESKDSDGYGSIEVIVTVH